MNLPRPFGPYELVRQLAVGGMAEVFVARARSVAGFEKVVALKMIHSRFSEDPEFARLLVEEANITAQLSHRNIVQVIDLGQVDGTHYIAMEYVDGMDLSRMLAKLRERGQLASARLAAFIMREVCDALDAAHRRTGADGKPLKIIHRDVSPPNILLSGAGDVKLTDFGIAKAALRASSTEAGVVKGKYAYMSPEQARAGVLDQRTDVFAAGAVLYELATGLPVYREAPLPILLEKVTKGIYEPPERARPELPAALAAVIKRALAVNSNERYPSARAMADDLNTFLYTLPPNPEFELSQLLGTMLESNRSSVPPMASVSLADDDSDDSTQIETMAVMRQKMSQATMRPPARPNDFTDEPTRTLRKGSFTAESSDDEVSQRTVAFLPNTEAPRVRQATPTPGPLPVMNAPSAPEPSPTIAPPSGGRGIGASRTNTFAGTPPPPRAGSSASLVANGSTVGPPPPPRTRIPSSSAMHAMQPPPMQRPATPMPEYMASSAPGASDASDAATLYPQHPGAAPTPAAPPGAMAFPPAQSQQPAGYPPPPNADPFAAQQSVPAMNHPQQQQPIQSGYGPAQNWGPPQQLMNGPGAGPAAPWGPPGYAQTPGAMMPTWDVDAQRAAELRQQRLLIVAAAFAAVAVLTLVVVLVTVH